VSEARGYQSQAVSYTVAGDVATCPIGSLAVGQTATVRFAGPVDAGTPDGTVLTDSAHVSATEVDDVPANNDSAAAVTVLAVPPAPAPPPPPTPEPGLPPTGAEIAATVQVSLLLLLTGATLVFAAFRGRDFRRPCEDEVRRGRYHRR